MRGPLPRPPVRERDASRRPYTVNTGGKGAGELRNPLEPDGDFRPVPYPQARSNVQPPTGWGEMRPLQIPKAAELPPHLPKPPPPPKQHPWRQADANAAYRQAHLSGPSHGKGKGKGKGKANKGSGKPGCTGNGTSGKP